MLPWPLLAKLLSAKFEHAVGSPLAQEHLEFLGKRLFGDQPQSDLASNSVTLTRLTRWPHTDTSFWSWFYEAMMLAEKAKDVWNQGLIMGFVSRSDAEQRLKEAPPGTFLIRFSERVVGGLTLAYQDPCMRVAMLQPFSKKELESLSLPRRIMRLPQLKYLYPSIPKEIFQRFTDPNAGQVKPPKGYLPVMLIPQVVE